MTCYAAYDDQAPTYYCTRPSGHDGWHAATDDDTGDLYQEWPQETTAHHGTPVPVTTRGVSSQAGIASYISTGPGAPVVRRRTFRAPCITPGCDGHLTMIRVRSSVDGDPTWRESCDSCPYELEL